MLRRLYVGSEIGQGYRGDEDNGEMSAWYLFSALGFYPLQVGSAELRDRLAAVQARRRSTWRTASDLVVNAPDNSAKNVYVAGPEGQRQGATTSAYLPHARARRRRRRSSSTWARSRRRGAPARTPRRRRSPRATRSPQPLRDATGGDAAPRASGGDAAALFDDDSSTHATLAGARGSQYRFAGGAAGDASTRSPRAPTPAATRASWVVKGSNDGRRWTALDERSGEAFRWRSQTRPFKLADRAATRYYRIEFTGGEPTLGEVELLNPAAPTPRRW